MKRLITVNGETGTPVYRIWRFYDSVFIFKKDSPPAVVVVVKLVVNGRDIEASFALMSGERLSDGVFQINAPDGVDGPALMAVLA